MEDSMVSSNTRPQKSCKSKEVKGSMPLDPDIGWPYRCSDDEVVKVLTARHTMVRFWAEGIEGDHNLLLYLGHIVGELRFNMSTTDGTPEELDRVAWFACFVGRLHFIKEKQVPGQDFDLPILPQREGSRRLPK